MASRKRPTSEPEASAVETAFGRDERFMARVPRRFRDQIAELKASQADKITDGLRADDVQELFLRDPAAALDRLGVEMPRDLRKRMRRMKGIRELDALRSPKPIRLPNGQTITPKVRIRLTAGDDA